jgi:hypothetical protein
MSEEEKGFVIRDRRNRGDDALSSGATSSHEARPETGTRAEPREGSLHAEHHPPPSFLSFVYSLGTSALMMLGEHGGLETSDPSQNLVHAQEIIDILTILETKTKGNLTTEEETLLQEMLYTLRIKYVEKASKS